MKRNALHSCMLAKWVGDAVNFMPEKNQAELARRLTARLRRGIGAAAVNKMISGERAVAADEMLAIAEITGYPLLINLEGALLDTGDRTKPGFNEGHLVKLFSYALEWKGVPEELARNMSAALLGAARKHPDRQDSELTDDQLRRVVAALTEAFGPQRTR